VIVKGQDIWDVMVWDFLSTVNKFWITLVINFSKMCCRV